MFSAEHAGKSNMWIRTFQKLLQRVDRTRYSHFIQLIIPSQKIQIRNTLFMILVHVNELYLFIYFIFWTSWEKISWNREVLVWFLQYGKCIVISICCGSHANCCCCSANISRNSSKLAGAVIAAVGVLSHRPPQCDFVYPLNSIITSDSLLYTSTHGNTPNVYKLTESGSFIQTHRTDG